MKTMMELALLQKVQEQEMMLSPASLAIPAAGCSQGAVSFAQERIWLDEKIHHDPSISPAMHNFVLPLVIKHGSMSIERIRSTVVAVIEQHEILRTAIYFDKNRNMLVQAVQSVDNNDAYSFEITANDIQGFDEIADLLRNESAKHFAELEHGLVVRCHLVKVGSDDDMDKLYPQDLIIFIFHGVAFDYNSINPFLVAFTKAYDQMELDFERLQYISFSLCERQQFINIPKDSQIRRAQQFWSKLMDDYSLDVNYPTPFTRPFDTKKRSGEGHSTSFILDSTLVKAQMEFASLHGLSMFHTALACFFLFIYELNDGTISDLCVTCPTENRSFVDTKRMIGTFANLLPYRIKINANESFINLVQRICQLDMDILNHCQLPYQQIIKGNTELCSSKIPLHFQYEETHSSSTSEIKSIAKTNDAILSLYTEQPWLYGNGIASHDMNLKIIHNQFSQTTYCIFECSADCYDEVTVSNMGRYFQNLLSHIFTENTKTIGFDPIFEKIGNLSLLPMNVENLSNVIESLRHFSEINAFIEQHMPMIGASMFWHDALHDYKLDQSLLLPYDRYRPTNGYRSGFGTSVSFDLDRNLCDTFLYYTSSQNISPEHLMLSMYFVFLFKLTNGETDLCIGMNVDGRYRDELRSVIGMFVNAIPLRCQLDPQWFLHELVKHVQEILTNSRKYSYFPLQRILDQHPHASKPAFLDTSFEFMRYSPQDLGKDMTIGHSHLSIMPISIKISDNDIMNKFDFILSIQHDFDMNQLSCTINASLDLFNRQTVEKISQRFHFILHQLSASMIDNQMKKPIYEISLTLSNEQYLMESLNNTQVSFSSPVTCIHHEFVFQVMKHPQKLAVELDEQSLTYCELLYYVQVLSLTLLNEYLITPGEIVCQCVERSLSMVIGIMAIEMVGSVYCPLSPRDPEQRLHAFVQRTQSRLVLVHWLTKMKFNNDSLTTNIHSILANNDVMSDIDADRLSGITVTPSDIAYIIFTSGSTGIPKAIQARHENLIHFMNSLVRLDVFNKDDTVVQIGRCSFDIHVQEILGTLMHGASLVMVRPGGTLDFDYLSNIVQMKQITYMFMVPSLLQSFFTFIAQSSKITTSKYFRSLCGGGEPFSVKLSTLIANNSVSEYNVWNYYGPAEITIACTFHLIDVKVNSSSIPIGRSPPNYQCLILNKFLQSTSINQEGELFVGGMGVFAGYLGHDDLTSKALLEIDGQLFYRTGDLVTIDNNGLLHFQGRKDHQIKLHGQRIELGEIERCLLNITSISACVVIKYNEDHLVAYVQSSHVNEEQLRQHCQSNLPPHMIPSFFIILDKLPLNQNGKIDRKLLPSPHYPSSTIPSLRELDTPVSQMEKNVYDIWCQVLEHNGRSISTTSNFFTIGGHSRLFIELYHRYQTIFGFDSRTLSISPFLEQPTIQQHAKLLKAVTTDNIRREQWCSLHINRSMASFAQERIFLDEQIRFSNKHIFYNNFVALRVTEGVLSTSRVLQALQLVLRKHEILRTSLVFNNDDSTLHQYVTDNHKTFTFLDQQTFESDNELQNIIYRTVINPDLFDLSSGRVFSCQIFQQQKTTHETAHTDSLDKYDVLVLYFHHAAVDGTSIPILLNGFYNAYSNNMTVSLDEQSVKYIDYAVYERIMDMTSSRNFWYSQLERFNLQRALKLPVDRHRLSAAQRSSLASVAQISFDKELSMIFLNYASLHQITPFQLGLTAFYVFLFKLTHGETDLCIASLNANRYGSELENMIGMFVSTLPYCVQLNSHWSFDELVKHVQEKCLSILKHSHYPLQHILTDFRLNQLDVPFLELVFNFLPVSTNIDRYSIDNVCLEQVSIEQADEISQFDFSTMFLYNPTSDDHKLSCRFSCSHDLFDNTTVKTIAQRFQHLLSQLFLTNSNGMENNLSIKSIKNLSLILPEEADEIYTLSLDRVIGVTTEAPASFAQARIWLDERIRFDTDKPQTAIYNMPFVYHLQSDHTLSITQLRRALHLTVNKHPLLHTSLPFDIQKNLLMQRVITDDDKNNNMFSIIETIYETDEQLNEILHDEKRNPHLFDLAQGLVIGIMGIEMAGGVYCPLSPRDPEHRLHALTKQTQSRLVLVHHFTMNKLNDNIISLNTELVFTDNYLKCDTDVEQLSSINVTSDNIAYITFTSGSTGVPKANFNDNPLVTLRSLAIGGETVSHKLVYHLNHYVQETCYMWDVYGPAETTMLSTFYLIDSICGHLDVPIGSLLANYQCKVFDVYLQPVSIGEEGELFVGGVGVFAGYLGRDDLTAKALVEIGGQLFYRTGDLVTIDNNGLLHYQGRKDYQIKLRGQRIELGEIERCLLNITSISACVVMKWNDDYLVAYVQSSHTKEEQLREHCQSHLPSHMIPSIFIVLDKLPLNQNGKIDRKHLPTPNFSSSTDNIDGNMPHTTLEEQLQDIFSQAFHIESPHVDVSFGQLGGTSLGAILALTLIRQQICNKVDIGLLFTNPSIRKLAKVIAPLLIFEELEETASTVNEYHEIHDHLAPSFVIESLGVMLLVCQWLLPIMIIHRWCPLLFPILPVCHLLFYIICSRLLSPQKIKDDNIFSWNYYRWWFLDRVWSNNTFWLQHILGTPLYNCYLRLCGARVSLNAHIYTITMDAPWLLDIDDGTWIADNTTLNCLYYNDNDTFALNSIRIGCYCSISARSILFGGVDMQDNIIVQPMSSVTGFIASRTTIDGDEQKSTSSDISITHSNRLLSTWHKIYQVITIISLICIHCTLLFMAYKVYSIEQLPLLISIAFCWTLWSILACFVTLFLLKFVVGSCAAGETYPFGSWSYLHKVWFRQLIVSSFHHAWSLPILYDHLFPFILRWLGAQVEDDVKLVRIHTFLSYPTNLLKIETGVTVFGYVLLVPTEMTLEGDHRVDYITLGSHTNLGNMCSILPGSHLASHTMVGNLTRITRETISNNRDVFIGVPASAMPFQMPIREATDDQIKTTPFWKTCFSHYISKCLLTGIYWSCGLIGGPILHTIIVCSFDRWHLYTDNEIIEQIIRRLQVDHEIFICTFLGNTQWLIRLFRAYGANIGNNVILPDVCSIFDYNLVTIGDHVRLNMNAIIVGHTFEQRILKLVPVTVGNSCVLMSGSFVMSGCKLMGNNRLYPFTLVMKNDLLQSNTQWKGLPAQSYVAKPILSRSVPICDDIVKCEQKSKNFDRLSLWYEQVSNVYKNVNELQFMNWGYADLDEHIDDNTGYYSKKLYQQVLANVTLTDQNILEVGCGRGAGAAWCIRTYAPRSYIGIDPSRDVINLCQQYYSTIHRLSFMIADPKIHLPFQNESINVVLSIETTNIFDEREVVKKFVNEITRVLTADGYFLWCGLCNVDGSSVLIDYLTANNAFIIKEKVNITRNVLHALDMQSNSRADFIERYIQPADQEYYRLFAGLPGTQLYNNMQQGHAEYYRVVFRKKIIKNTLHI
ncbi:unnamed protein product [Adineta steineri]|uniref:Carrier domain-containing protein n=1 Tax=Adineta steineri TaxID=433720 RepID=A0A814F5C1_9BILA|nr:unnamed protein product [Adineta steineri]CAF0997900.1 unnamed protein product [Adineta steineri]